MRPALPTAWLLLALTALYFVAGKLGLSFATLHSSASAVWPPTGIALAALLLLGNRVWPAIFVGAFLVNVTTAGSIPASLGIAAGNTFEGLAGAYLVSRFAGGAACFERARDVFKFAALAAIAATAVSATMGVATLVLAGLANLENLLPIWLTWWLGDAAGALIVTPVLMLWHSTPRPAIPHEDRVEALLIFGVVVLVAAACFVVPGLRDYPLSFLCLPPLAWIAFRFGPREVATAIALVAAIAVVATQRGYGPFVMATDNESFLLLQAFMGMVAMTLLPMGALVRERRLATTVAEAATRSRDVFLAMLSHELRNPMQAITTSLHILDHRGSRPEEADRAIAIASRQSEHLSRLLNDLLDVARAVSGKVRIDLAPLRLDEAARRCVDALQGSERLGARALSIEADPVVVSADPARLEQIVGNLLSNAIKFTPANGTIHVTVGEEGGEGVLRVRDDGIGMPQELVPKVFDLFTQGERKLDRGEGGLGIGLTLVHTLADLQGGSAQAHSAGPGKGSEFVVRLPRAAAAPEAPAAPPRPFARPSRVLIIEDNDDARESLHAVLAGEGHDVYEASNGEDGIAIAERNRPDVVLVDIGLPLLDGYEVARRLRTRQSDLGTSWRLIAITGYGQPEDVRRSAEAGFDSHLVKPVMPAAVLAAIAQGG
ncbi:MAG TPA: MASE1 domain-containing protein [Usitatibacter sp.]|nr:MASE1 domain-containing protein [Usitatibacter sp.]